MVASSSREPATTSLENALADLIPSHAGAAAIAAARVGCGIVAFPSNLVTNLPARLLAGAAVQGAEAPRTVAASILWLAAIRREDETVSAWAFLKIGILVMPPALILALAALLLA